MKIDGDQKLITVFMSKTKRAERWLWVWVLPSPSSTTSSKRLPGNGFALASRTEGLVCSIHGSQETNGTSLELKNIFIIAVLQQKLENCSQEENKSNIPGERGKKKKGKKPNHQVPLFQMAPTAIPQRANINFGWGHVQHL